MSNFVKLVLREEVLRKMNRERYKATRHFLRLAARKISQKMEGVDMSKKFLELLTTGKTIL